MPALKCDLCSTPNAHDLIQLPLCAFGSEGIRVCLPCRLVLTNVAIGLRQAAGRCRLAAHMERNRTP